VRRTLDEPTAERIVAAYDRDCVQHSIEGIRTLSPERL
jgi:protein required for attachment to host cells